MARRLTFQEIGCRNYLHLNPFLLSIYLRHLSLRLIRLAVDKRYNEAGSAFTHRAICLI